VSECPNCSNFISLICCGFVVQLVVQVQQIYTTICNQSNQRSLSITEQLKLDVFVRTHIFAGTVCAFLIPILLNGANWSVVTDDSIGVLLKHYP